MANSFRKIFSLYFGTVDEETGIDGFFFVYFLKQAAVGKALDINNRLKYTQLSYSSD
jgi:hypothetical protein